MNGNESLHFFRWLASNSIVCFLAGIVADRIINAILDKFNENRKIKHARKKATKNIAKLSKEKFGDILQIIRVCF